jgi:hypothetical protein
MFFANPKLNIYDQHCHLAPLASSTPEIKEFLDVLAQRVTELQDEYDRLIQAQAEKPLLAKYIDLPGDSESELEIYQLIKKLSRLNSEYKFYKSLAQI